MYKSILNEEITRIREMMGITSKLILESPIPVSVTKLKNLLDTVFGIKNVADADAPGFFREMMKDLGNQGIKFSDNRITGMFNNELKPIKEFIIIQKQAGKSADEVKNAIESNYRELFDEGGVFKGYIDELYNSMSRKVQQKMKTSVDEILASKDFNDLIKNTRGGNQYKAELRKNWDKRYGWIFAETEITQTTIDKLITKIQKEYPIKANIFDKLKSTMVGKMLKSTIGNKYVRFALLAFLGYRLAECTYKTRIVKGQPTGQAKRSFGFCLGQGSIDMVAQIIGTTHEFVLGVLYGLFDDAVEDGSVITIESPQVVDSPEGWKEYCKQLNWSCNVDDDGSYRTNDYSYYEYSGTTPNGTFVFDKETTDVKRTERKAEKARKEVESRRRQQQQQEKPDNSGEDNVDWTKYK